MIKKITFEERRELNRILGLIKSPDTEAMKLGVDLFTTSPILQDFRSMWYTNKFGKELPISWYLRKIDQIKKNQKENEKDDPWEYRGLILPILKSILLGEPNFKAHVTIEFEEEEKL